MNNTEMMKTVDSYIQEICHYSQKQVFATSSYQKKFFKLQIDDEVLRLVNFIRNNRIDPEKVQPSQLMGDQKVEQVITMEELEKNDGSNGNPAYVAVNGNVYDLTLVIQWAGGTHFGLYAGKNLTNEFMGCHNGALEILQKLPKVGVLG